ncbi:hypothetical protein PoB_002478700 [Plakobranchus ocellatus]|uniref:Uncharacterized protein n=1 Tax=Plakobranchus ocellatus TaxID=259542 RepID=A0AAV3ZT18_9GAST|nr:hypothetical protein PoB_002478700 [Plakobranchus ocellatus]
MKERQGKWRSTVSKTGSRMAERQGKWRSSSRFKVEGDMKKQQQGQGEKEEEQVEQVEKQEEEEKWRSRKSRKGGWRGGGAEGWRRRIIE